MSEGLGLSAGQARRAGELLRGLYELALEMGWRFDGERWVKPETLRQAQGDVIQGGRSDGRGSGVGLCVDGV